jgi:1-acyl-sn-glycerol-3-phosphate acyltransferase
MQWLRSAILVFLVYLLMAVMGLAGAPVVLWSRAWTSRWAKLYARGVFALSRWICGLRVEVRGPVPAGPVVVAAKHQSLLGPRCSGFMRCGQARSGSPARSAARARR